MFTPANFEEQLFFTTLRIEHTTADEEKSEGGTGFIVGYPLPNCPGHSVLALVTCKHLLREGRGKVTLRFHKRSGTDRAVPELGETINIDAATFSEAYYTHTEEDLDIAAINISKLVEDSKKCFTIAIGRHNFIGSDDRLSVLQEVVFVGYPDDFYDSKHNLPIARFGHIATLPQINFEGQPRFLIDAHVFSGSSGSPVFTKCGHEYKFIGMVGQSVYREAPIRVKDGDSEFDLTTFKDFIGLGVVYKPKAILDLVQKIAEEIAKVPK